MTEQQAMAVVSRRDTTSSGAVGGVVTLLDLPSGTIVGLDGRTIVLQRDDFVGFHNVPSTAVTRHGGTKSPSFHLVTTRSSQQQGQQDQSSMGITVGFVIFNSDANTNEEYCMLLARRHDPKTQEVSSLPLDQVTQSNLLQTIVSGRIEPHRIISYQDIEKGHTASVSQRNSFEWICQTNYISSNLLELLGLATGDKVVPGTFQIDESGKPQHHQQRETDVVVDGTSVTYPPIPVLLDSDALQQHGRTTHHEGTKRYLTRLSPSEKTALFIGNEPPSKVVLQHVLQLYYENDWKNLLGDLQLAFVLFLQLQCLSSMEHWRDLISMLSCVQFDSQTTSPQQLELYRGVLDVLSIQFSFMEQDLFEDLEMSGDNFFVPAIQRLHSLCSQVCDVDDKMRKSVEDFTNILSNQFPTLSLLPQGTSQANDEEETRDVEMNGTNELPMRQRNNHDEDVFYEDDDEDGPVVVSSQEVEAAMERSKSQSNNRQEHPREHVKAYPLLFASLSPSEDVVMACARILDEASDVSLVREAAAYLEEVESIRTG